uniref:Non-haem dioxygenase N-terminal domain-containing protein n=1 Tax=Oryza rufipogon TaxID=4529 RepID=A0A0E0QIJ6_ORYRU
MATITGSSDRLRDLQAFDDTKAGVKSLVRVATETVGFFQVVNHDVAKELTDAMLAAVRYFHEEPLEAKAPYYTRDVGSKVRFSSNYDLFRPPAANWRDTLFMEMAPEGPSPEEIPPPTPRRLGEWLFELLSEALGLPAGYLGLDAGCKDGLGGATNYYRPCPELEATMGTTRQSDPSFLTVLLQDTSGGGFCFFRRLLLHCCICSTIARWTERN